MTDKQEIIEDAIAKRLQRLGAMPVDMAALERRIKAEIPTGEKAARPSILARTWKAGLSIAASLIVVAAIALSASPREVRADPLEIARVHRAMVSGEEMMHVNSIEAANDAIAAMASGHVKVPDVAGVVPHACCMKTLQRKPVACILLEDGDKPVSMTVARATDMKSPESGAREVGGVTYHVSKVDELSMVMTERAGRWICLVGAGGEERLVEIAGKIKF